MPVGAREAKRRRKQAGIHEIMYRIMFSYLSQM